MRVRGHLAALLVVCGVVLAACDWPQFRSNASHAGSNFETTLNTGNVASLTTKWTATTGNVVNSSPAVANGVVYVGSGDNKLYAFDATTGATLWTATTGDVVRSSPAVANGIVYVGGGDGKLYAFDAAGTTNCSGTPKTCSPLWTSVTLGYSLFSSPVVANGFAYIGSPGPNIDLTNGELYAFDALGTTNCSGTPKTCSPLWANGTGGYPVFSSPAVANGIVYVSVGYNVYAFDAATGASKWAATTGGIEASSPAVVNGAVYVGSLDNKVYAFNAGTGAILWTAATGNQVFSSPAVANGIVYVGSDDNKLWAFNASTGATVWTATTSNPVDASPAVANGVVYVGSDDNTLYALNATTGATLWTASTGGAVSVPSSSPAVANGMIYVGSSDTKVHAFGLP
jgi:eukaryotic-like serine/threonine-protein kinase